MHDGGRTHRWVCGCAARRSKAPEGAHSAPRAKGMDMARTIVVTGASSGVGLAAAEQFAAQGDQVVVVGRTEERLEAAVARVRAAGGGREPGRFLADFERLADVRDLAARLLDAYPAIDVLANNAG